MKTLKNLSVIASAVILLGAITVYGSGGQYPNPFFYRSSGALLPVNANDTLGTASNPIANLFVTACTGCSSGGVANPLTSNLAGGAFTITNVNLTVNNSSTTNATTTGNINITPKSALITPIAGDFGIDTTSGQWRYADVTDTVRVLQPVNERTVGYATSTTWTGTTTRSLGFAAFNQTWSSATCGTIGGTTTISIDDGTNVTNYIIASSTAGNIALTSNNSFVKDEKRRINIGNPIGSPVEVSCTFKFTADTD